MAVLIIFLCLSIGIGATARAAAPSGHIAGVVKDATTGDALPGANVSIVGTALGTSTDLSGDFAIKRIPVGAYTLRVTFIGYESKEQPVAIEPDGDVFLEIKLVSTVVAGGNNTQTAQPEGQITPTK